MRPKVCTPHIAKEWNLFFTDGREGLYHCFMLFYDDFYRLGLHWYKTPDFVKECIHNLFLELWKDWERREHVNNKKQYVIAVYKRVCHKTFQDYDSKSAAPILQGDAVEPWEQSYEELLVISQSEEHTRDKLRAALERLTKRQKQIIELRFYKNQPISEIAILLSLTERTVYNTLHSAIRTLRSYLLSLIYLLLHCQ
ncbi:sigma-70 family RNA polymerase sigma factor [Parapedobacter deserti]|uniref:Sigma-70 family RNA polymerase sigma factor n=1 Tax=Parapedobacter deserti TaxID=1912957 RepID=A0ABV7JQ64_9SPHI